MWCFLVNIWIFTRFVLLKSNILIFKFDGIILTYQLPAMLGDIIMMLEYYKLY